MFLKKINMQSKILDLLKARLIICFKENWLLSLMFLLLQTWLADVLTLICWQETQCICPRDQFCDWEEGKSSWVLPIHCFLLCGWQQAANFNKLFIPFRSPAYCDMIPWLQTLLISPFIRLKLISVVSGIFKAQAQLHTELLAKERTHVMHHSFFFTPLSYQQRSVQWPYWSAGIEVFMKKSHSSRFTSLIATDNALYQCTYLKECFLIGL